MESSRELSRAVECGAVSWSGVELTVDSSQF